MGEAVSIGVALDVRLFFVRSRFSPRQGRTDLAGPRRSTAPHFPFPFAASSIFEGLEEFRQHLGGRLDLDDARDVGRMIQVHSIDTGG